ncbi:MAG: SMP-30/gluconolactonase/LRE family protein [Planctomycetia bacterium]|nr:SMP-30/gluconolactonase/LRE family protein [Planctomycetia bacterium]
MATRWTMICGLLAWLVPVASARAGYELPCHIDGCQSPDGRFVITAEPVGKLTNHGPNQWQFVWKDTKANKTEKFMARGVQGGQVHAQLFIAPDGETFALFNHVTLWTEGKSDMHGAGKLCDQPGKPRNRMDDHFSRRLIVYRKDGSIVKELGVNDFLKPEEWDATLAVFNRIHWLKEYPGLNFKTTPRHAYAFYQVSPDYTVLELQLTPPRGAKAPRVVRVSLTDGRILDSEEKLDDKHKIPVRPFRGEATLPDTTPTTRESYVPSLDPVRQEGTFKTAASVDGAPAANPSARLELVKDGFTKLDTPAWLPNEKCLLVTDLEQKKLFRLDPPGKFATVRDEACRGKVGPDGRFYGVLGGKLASWRPGEEPQVILEKASEGRDLSLNDLTLSARDFLYFTTLKDPDKGRLSVVNLRSKTVTVAFDGEKETALANPNGVALSPDGKFLYVGISNYKDRGKSGIYRFPVKDDGSLDLEAGKKNKWANVSGPDGLAVAADGQVYATAGGVVVILTPDGKNAGSLKIPQGSGTNLTFGADEKVLYVTTDRALYVANLKP